jgi:hypothetical protein
LLSEPGSDDPEIDDFDGTRTVGDGVLILTYALPDPTESYQVVF